MGATGRPSDYCSPECQRLVHAERKAVAARVRRLEEVLRQARTDLDGFSAHDLENLSAALTTSAWRWRWARLVLPSSTLSRTTLGCPS